METSARKIGKGLLVILGILFLTPSSMAQSDSKSDADNNTEETTPMGDEAEGIAAQGEDMDLSPSSGTNIFVQAFNSGPVVFFVLITLIAMSIIAWGIIVLKWLYLGKVSTSSESFVKSFWDSRSLNELNSKLGEFDYSPNKELFKTGYTELIRSNSIKDQIASVNLAVSSAMDNLQRTLHKIKISEKAQLEKFVNVLATIASTAPFIGLFGTVWGIMNAFEGIARSGNANLSSVAPGISEALIATAFGLAAAIPAAIFYNVFVRKIRLRVSEMDSFSVDFLNIVERYLVSDRSRPSDGQSIGQSLSGTADKI